RRTPPPTAPLPDRGAPTAIVSAAARRDPSSCRGSRGAREAHARGPQPPRDLHVLGGGAGRALALVVEILPGHALHLGRGGQVDQRARSPLRRPGDGLTELYEVYRENPVVLPEPRPDEARVHRVGSPPGPLQP